MISVLGAIARAITGGIQLPQHVCLFYRKEGYSVGAVELDLILDESHSKSAQVTEHPMQDGRAVSDGIFNELRDGTLTALVSNHSIKHSIKPAEQRSFLEGVTDSLGITSPTDDMLKQAEGFSLENRARTAWEELKSIMDRKELVTVVTSLEVYENVAITLIDTERDGDSGDALEIRIQFRQVRKVGLREDKVSAQVQPSDMDSDINRQAAVGTSGGQQVGSEPSEADKEQLMLGVQ